MCDIAIVSWSFLPASNLFFIATFNCRDVHLKSIKWTAIFWYNINSLLISITNTVLTSQSLFLGTISPNLVSNWSLFLEFGPYFSKNYVITKKLYFWSAQLRLNFSESQSTEEKIVSISCICVCVGGHNVQLMIFLNIGLCFSAIWSLKGLYFALMLVPIRSL